MDRRSFFSKLILSLSSIPFFSFLKLGGSDKLNEDNTLKPFEMPEFRRQGDYYKAITFDGAKWSPSFNTYHKNPYKLEPWRPLKRVALVNIEGSIWEEVEIDDVKEYDLYFVIHKDDVGYKHGNRQCNVAYIEIPDGSLHTMTMKA